MAYTCCYCEEEFDGHRDALDHECDEKPEVVG